MENEDKPKVRSIETYTDDMLKVLETDKGGIIKKIIEEEDLKEERKKAYSPENIRNKALIWTGSILLIIAVASLFFVFVYNKKIATVPIVPQFTPIIFTDKNSFFPIDELSEKKNIISLINERAVSTEVKKEGIEGMHLTEKGITITAQNFLSKIKGGFPAEGAQYLESNFLLGVFRDKEDNKHPFVLLKVRSFPEIFPYMRAWEGRMFTDLHDFFNVSLIPQNSYLQAKNFQDEIVMNKSARVLYDSEENVVFMYIFADDNSIIITDSMVSAKEVINRIASSKVRK